MEDSNYSIQHPVDGENWECSGDNLPMEEIEVEGSSSEIIISEERSNHDNPSDMEENGTEPQYFDESIRATEVIVIDEDEDDDVLIDGEVKYTNEEMIGIRIAKIDKLLSWFVKLKREFIIDCKINREDYIKHMLNDELVVDINTSKLYLTEYQNCYDVEEIMRKYNVESEFLVIMGICIATLEEANVRDIRFEPLCEDRVDGVSYHCTRQFLEHHDVGVDPTSKHGPSELMQSLAAPPAYATLALTIVWLEDNKCPLRCEWYSSDIIPCTGTECAEFSKMVIETVLSLWKENQEIEEESAKLGRTTNEILASIESTHTILREESERINKLRESMNSFSMGKTMKEIEDQELSDEFELMKGEDRKKMEKELENAKYVKKIIEMTRKETAEIRDKAKTLHESLVLWPGDFCLARTSPIDIQEFCLAVVQRQASCVSYVLRFVNDGSTEEVHIRDIGFARFGMMDGLVMQTSYVGMRVACLVPVRVEVKGNIGEFEERECWLSGTIAGRWMSHGNQFLVFLDNGDDVYVDAPFSPASDSVNEIYKIPLDTGDPHIIKKRLQMMKMVPIMAQAFNEIAVLDKSRVHDLLRDRTRAKFIKTFMQKYPEWPLVRAGIGNMFHIYDKFNQRQKSLVVVVNIDRVFCVVRHVENINHVGYGCTAYPCNENHLHNDEKIYRGSPRIRDILLDKDDMRHLSRRSRMKLYRNFDMAEPERTMPVLGNVEEENTQGKNVVRRKNLKKNAEKAAKMSSGEIADRKKNQNLMIKVINHTPILKPLKNLKYHPSCGPDCLKGMDSDPFDSKFHTCSPLHVPLICGWRRYKYTLKAFKKRGMKKSTIMYYAPCGKPLPSMKTIENYLRETSSMITIDCFSFDIYVDTETYMAFDPKYVKMTDYTGGIEGIPIPAVNSVDGEEPPKIEYTKRRFQYDSSVDISTISRDFCSGCSCDGDCSDASKCECQLLSLEAYNRLPEQMKFTNKKKVPRYESRLLSEKVNSGIYECNDQCSCHRKTCFNRVVQNNIKYPMAIFKTAESGWGVRALTDIPKGAFLCNYVGALLTNELADALQNEDQYFADIDMKDVVELEKMRIDLEKDLGFEEDLSESESEKKEGDDDGFVQSDDENSMNSEDSNLRKSARKADQKKVAQKKKKEKRKTPERFFQWESYFNGKALFVLDAKQRGNLGRFLNHSCDPNVTVQHVLYDTHDLRLPWVSFFAQRAVKAGEELCWNYNYPIDPEAEEHINCNCGADNCRGILI